ncbi:15826_t:CDS:1, partial [Dentiscutata heterogama]
ITKNEEAALLNVRNAIWRIFEAEKFLLLKYNTFASEIVRWKRSNK